MNIKEKIAPVNTCGISDVKNLKVRRCKECNLLFNTKINFVTRKHYHEKCLLCRMEAGYIKNEYIIKHFIDYGVLNFRELQDKFIKRHIDLERRRLNELKVKGVILKNIPICNRI